MVRQQIGFLMIVVAATAGIMVIATIADIVNNKKHSDNGTERY